MKAIFNKTLNISFVLLALIVFSGNAWGTVLFHETFGSNSGSARAWDDTYKVQTGVTAVYSGATSYTVTNAKQSKNNMGYGTTLTTDNTDGSGIVSNQATQGTVIIGPLNVSSYSSLALTHWFAKTSGGSTWDESRASNPDVMKVSYSTNNSTWTALTRTGTPTVPIGQTTTNHGYVQASYTLPAAAEVSTLYLKFEFYCYQVDKNGNQIGYAYIDEIDLTGTLSYDVTYNNGGHGTAPSNTKALDLTLPSMTATGYTFNGWKADKAVTNKSTTATIAANTLITSGTIVTLSQATTFTAQWTAKTTTVSFNQNSGTGGQTSSVSATYDQAMPTPITTPTRDHYDFGGYYDGAGGTGTQYYTNTGASAHTWNKDAATATLYAKWTEHALTNYHTRCLTVTYAAGEGSGTAPSSHEKVNPNSSITLAANTFTAPTGKAFAGWNDGSSTYDEGDEYTVTASKTMTAQWAFIDYNVTYSAPSNGNYTIKVADGEASSATKTAHYGQTITLAATPTTGYHFSSWTIKKTSDNSDVTSSVSLSSSTNKDATFTMPDYGVTVTATFAINQHTITWKSEDGTSTLETDGSQNYGTATAFNGATPTKATTASYTYTFDGWTTAANGEGTFYANGSTPTVSGDATYYAHFSAAENVASVTVGGATTYYTTLAGAMGDAMLSDNSTIKILNDISGQPALTYNVAKKCTLDLNNHTVAGTVTKLLTINNASANFTITDNSVAKGGVLKTVVSSNARVYCLYLTAGTVNMENGKVYCQNTYTYNSSSAKNVAASAVYVTASQTFTMNNGTLESEAQYGSYALYIAQGTSTVTVNGGLIKGYTNKSTTASGIYNLAKGLTINNGHIIGHSYTSTSYGLYLHGGHATVNGGTIEATNDTTNNKGTTTAYGIYVAYKSNTYKGVLTIPSSSTVNVLAKARTTTASAVTVGGSSTGSTIAGGTFTAWTKTSTTAYGVYSSGNITISGGTFNVNSKTTTAYGIYATRGTTTVNSTPTFNVKAGSTIACGALASGTVGKAGTGKYSGTITINGGTFNVTSTAETAYGARAGLYARTVSITDDKAEPNDTILGQHYMPGIINVTDGTFNVKATTNTAYGIYVDAKNTESGEVGSTVKIPQATITGGKFEITSAGDATLAYAMNTAADNADLVVQGGYYSTKKTDSGNIEDKYTAPTKSCNYHVFTPSGVAGYDYKVAEGYTLTWNLNGGTVTTAGTGAAVDATGTPNIVVEKGASITAPTVTKTGYTFSSWSPSVPAAMPAANTTYAATWTANTITITWNPNGEGASVTPTSSSYTYDGSTVTLPTPTRPLSVFTGWYTDASGGTEITEVGTTNKPTEDVTYYAHWRVLSFEVKDQAGTGTADIHLTSTRGATVYATSACGNLITIKADNLDAISNLGGGTANKQNIQIKYLDANNGDAEVAKASSPFRLCNDGSSNYNYVDASSSNININGLTEYSQTYSISYTPSEYGKIDHYKLQLRLQNNNTEAITITFDLYGRSLPDEFVIAAKYADDNKWYALPNTLGTTSSASAPTPIEISVDNTTTPTKAMNVPSTLLYKACDRYNNSPKTQFASIRFTSNGTNHLQASSGASSYQLWLAPSDNAVAQNWYLKSSDFGAYEMQWDPAQGSTKLLGFYNSSGIKMGFHGTAPKGHDIYFLPVEYTDMSAEIMEWGTDHVVVDLRSAGSATKVKTQVGTGALSSAQTLASIKKDEGVYRVAVTLSESDAAKNLKLLFYNDSEVMQGGAKNTIPLLISDDDATTGSLSLSKDDAATCDLVVLDGGVLTVSETTDAAKYTFQDLYVYGGGKMVVPTGTYINFSNVYMRGGHLNSSWEYQYSNPQLILNGTMGNSSNTINYDYLTNNAQFYSLALPYQVQLANIVNPYFSNKQSWEIHAYDGTKRASGSQVDGWYDVEVGSTGTNTGNIAALTSSSYLTPGVGYTFWGAMQKVNSIRQKWSINRFPMTLASGSAEAAKAGVSVGAYGMTDGMPNDGVAVNDAGWNMLGNPYLANIGGTESFESSLSALIVGYHNQKVLDDKGNWTGAWEEVEDAANVRYVRIPHDNGMDYDQVRVKDATFKSFRHFFIQAATTGTFTFSLSQRAQEAPARVQNNGATLPDEMDIDFILSNGEEQATFGLTVNDKLNTGFVVGEDMPEELGGTSSKAYTIAAENKLAYNGLPSTAAEQYIPVGYRAEAAGTYSIAYKPDEYTTYIEHIQLIDYATGEVTDLLDGTYEFSTEQGVFDERFALNVEFGRRNIPTGTEETNINGDKPVKFIRDDKMYIMRNGVIYDATGKKVDGINK